MPYSPLEGALPPLFQTLTDETISHYRDVPWSEEELFFIACTFTSHLLARFQDDFETQPIILIDLPTNMVLTKV